MNLKKGTDVDSTGILSAFGHKCVDNKKDNARGAGQYTQPMKATRHYGGTSNIDIDGKTGNPNEGMFGVSPSLQHRHLPMTASHKNVDVHSSYWKKVRFSVTSLCRPNSGRRSVDTAALNNELSRFRSLEDCTSTPVNHSHVAQSIDCLTESSQ